MPKYRYKGVMVEADSPEAAKALVKQHLGGSRVTPTNEYNPTEGMSTEDQILAGIGSGLVNVGRQTANMLLPEAMQPDWATDEAIAEQARLDAALMETGAGTGGRIIGEVAGSMLPGGAAGMGARAALGAGRRVLPLAVAAGTEGAVLAGPGERGAGAATGAALGGALGLGGKAVGRMYRPAASNTRSAQLLQREGIDLMPGLANRGGLLKAMEESAAGKLMPGVAQARQTNIDDAVRVMMKRAAPSRAARESIELNKGGALSEDLDNLYKSFEDVYGGVKNVRVKFKTRNGEDLGMALRDLARGLPADDLVRTRVERVLNRELQNLSRKSVGNKLKSDDLIEMRTRIRDHVRAINKSGNADPYELSAWDEVDDLISDSLEHQLPDIMKGLLRRGDRQYAKYKTVEEIVGSRMDGPMTANAISRGVTNTEKRLASRGAAARGGNRTGFRDISDAISEVSRLGTTPTGMSAVLPAAGALAGGALSSTGLGALAGGAAMGLAPSLAAGSRVLRRALTGQTSPQRALARTMDLINRPIDTIGLGGTAAGLSYMNQE